MKILKITIVLFISIILFSCENGKKTQTQEIENKQFDKTINKIEVINFYGTHRCTTCKNIEANTKYTIENFFKEEYDNGFIEIRLINVDDDANYNIAEKYQATGTAMFLNVVKDGIENHIDLTEFAFQWGNEQVEFSMELESKLKNELNNFK